MLERKASAVFEKKHKEKLFKSFSFHRQTSKKNKKTILRDRAGYQVQIFKTMSGI
jgi:hypothetical protein